MSGETVIASQPPGDVAINQRMVRHDRMQESGRFELDSR
jgi:hypothetical protein